MAHWDVTVFDKNNMGWTVGKQAPAAIVDGHALSVNETIVSTGKFINPDTAHPFGGYPFGTAIVVFQGMSPPSPGKAVVCAALKGFSGGVTGDTIRILSGNHAGRMFTYDGMWQGGAWCPDAFC